MNPRRWLLPCACLALCALAADWPQWRGPERTGISKETGLLQEWPKDGPKLLWESKEIGGGYSTPSVVGDRIYLMGDKDGKEFVLALNAADGKAVWTAPVGNVGKNRGPQYPGARSTPTVDGELLYALGSDGDLVCVETATGKERWRKSFSKDFAGAPGMWAYSESPLVDGDVLVCTPGGVKATMVGLNKKTGDAVWQSAMEDAGQAAYSSPIVIQTGPVKQYVQMLQKGLVGVDAKTGRELWLYKGTTGSSPANIPTPVFHDGLVYSATGYGGGGAVKLAAEKDGVTATEVYRAPDLPNAIGGAVLVGDSLYGTFSVGRGKEEGLKCVEFATGKVKWKDKGVGAAGICYADNRLYLHGENGEVALVEATPEAYRDKGRFTPPNRPKHTKMMEKAWAYPVVANGRLYLRDLDTLWCYDVKAGK
jgi:outer membrane protein assembly factor BamB